jgi:hypothetical protein
MSRLNTRSVAERRGHDRDFIREADMFFEARGEVHQTMRRLVKRLEKAGIPCAVMGGMAVNAHGHERMTKDVDVLLTRRGFQEFCKRYVPKDYALVPGRSRRFVDRESQRTVGILTTGLFPGRGTPGPIAFPDPEDVREQIKKIHYFDLKTLIELKLAARRWRDFADVVDLIRTHNLDEAYLSKLHPSVRQDFIECVEEKRREDQYDAMP